MKLRISIHEMETQVFLLDKVSLSLMECDLDRNINICVV